MCLHLLISEFACSLSCIYSVEECAICCDIFFGVPCHVDSRTAGVCRFSFSCYQVWVVSAAEPRLPLQIEDASRPDSADVSITR